MNVWRIRPGGYFCLISAYISGAVSGRQGNGRLIMMFDKEDPSHSLFLHSSLLRTSGSFSNLCNVPYHFSLAHASFCASSSNACGIWEGK